MGYYVTSGSVLDNITLTESEEMHISSGGTANNTIINDTAVVYVSSGGIANSTTVNAAGYMIFESGSVANDTTVNTGGNMFFYDGTANNTIVNNAGNMIFESNGIANNTTINDGGYVLFTDGGTANDTVIYDSGCLIMYNGTANNTTVHAGGYLGIENGGTASNITLSTSGIIYIASDSILTGTLQIADGAEAVIDGTVQLDISDRTAQDGSLIDSFSRISGSATYTVTISEDQSLGVYKLASGVESFTETITVSDNNDFYGSISANGKALNINGVDCYLFVQQGDLLLSFGDLAAPDLKITASITAPTNQDVVLSAEINEAGVIEYFNGKKWVVGNTITTTANGTYKFRCSDIAGNTAEKSFTVSNIDKTAPIVHGSFRKSEAGYMVSFIHNEAYGIAAYKVKYSSDGNNFTECTQAVTADTLLITNTDYIKTIKVYAIDHAGNVAFWRLLTPTVVPEAAGDLTIASISKVDGNKYVDKEIVAANAITPVIKESENSYSCKASSTAKNTLNISCDTNSTEFRRFATVNLTNAEVNAIAGGKADSSEELKSSVDKKGTVNNTAKYSYSSSANGKFTAKNSEAEKVSGYATVTLSDSETDFLQGGNIKIATGSKLVDSANSYQKTISEDIESAASGSATLQADSSADMIKGFSNVTVRNSEVGDIYNFTSKDSRSESATFDRSKKTVTRKVTISQTETTAGTLKATNSELDDVTGFATVTLQNVRESGNFRRVAENGKNYSTIKETLNIKTNKNSSVAATYSKTETFTRAGKFTATDSLVGDIENYSSVSLEDSRAEIISNFETAKIVTSGTALWQDMSAYGTPEDYDLNLDAMDLTVTETKSLNGSVTMKNSAASSISNFSTLTMENSSAGKVANINKVTVSKGDNHLANYSGTAGNDTFTIAKGAVLELSGALDLGAGSKDKLSLAGTLIMLKNADIANTQITGKGEIAADSNVFAKLDVDFANTLDVGETAENFRGTAYEKADDTVKKAFKWDGVSEYDGWLGDWSGYTTGSDDVDYIKFKARANDILSISGDAEYTLLDKNGKKVSESIFADGKFMATGEYIIEFKREDKTSSTYTISLGLPD